MNNQLGGCGSAVGDCFDFWMRNAMAVADSVIAEPTLKTGDAPKHAAATAPLTMRFADPLTQGKGRWLGAIEPADQSWICFVGMDGRALLWEKRDTADGYSPRAGMGIGDPVVFERDLATLNISEASAVSLSGEPARDDQGRFSGAGGGSAARKFGESAGANAVRVGNDKASGIQARLASDTAGKASRDTIKTADAHRSSAVAHTAAAEAHARAVADGNGPAHHAASEAHTAAAVAHKQAADGMDKRAKDAAIVNNKTDEHKAAVVRGAVAATQGARAVPGLAKFASLKAGDATSKAAGSGTASDHKMAANAHVTAAESHTAAATAAGRGKLDATNVALDAAHDPTNGQFTDAGSGSAGSVDHQAMALASRAEADRHEAKAASLKKAGGFFNTNRAQVKIHTDLAKIHRDNADRSEEAHKAGGGKLSVD